MFWDRETNVSMGLGGPIIEQCGFIFSILVGECEDEIEVDGGGIGLAAATFLRLMGVDVCLTFPWDREGW